MRKEGTWMNMKQKKGEKKWNGNLELDLDKQTNKQKPRFDWLITLVVFFNQFPFVILQKYHHFLLIHAFNTNQTLTLIIIIKCWNWCESFVRQKCLKWLWNKKNMIGWQYWINKKWIFGWCCCCSSDKLINGK